MAEKEEHTKRKHRKQRCAVGYDHNSHGNQYGSNATMTLPEVKWIQKRDVPSKRFA